MVNITPARFENALTLITQHQLNTPLVKLHRQQTPQKNDIFLKLESLQPSGSFKIRGATFAMTQLTDKQRQAGVITYSTGNHAQAVALAAQQWGCKAIIVMSPDVPELKIKATQKYGAEIIMTDPSSEARQALAEELVVSKGYSLIPPYDHEDVITGQGTVGLEILQQIKPAAVFVPVGGGGLIAGIALAIKQHDPQIKIIGVEPALEDDVYRSYQAKKRIRLNSTSQSIADAVRVLQPGKLSFPVILDKVDEMLLIGEEEIAKSTIFAINQHIWLEPSGALGIAAAINYKGHFNRPGPVVCVVSGGNTNLDFICQLNNKY